MDNALQTEGPASAPIDSGMIFSLLFDGKGGGRALTWQQFMESWNRPGIVWLNCDWRGETMEHWVRVESGASEAQADYLLADETRPGLILGGGSIMLIIRAINRTPGQEPHDLVSVRIWLDDDHILTFRSRKTGILSGIRDELAAGQGPSLAGDFVVTFLENTVFEIHGYVLGLAESLADFEEIAQPGDMAATKAHLNQAKMIATRLRKHLIPQQQVIESLGSARIPWITNEDRDQIRNVLERSKRLIDDLDIILERVRGVETDHERRDAEILNRRMYVLAVLTAVFLPLNLVASFLGMNVGGVPGQENAYGFAITVVSLIVIGTGAVWLLRRCRLF